jgi:hypothetical protein
MTHRSLASTCAGGRNPGSRRPPGLSRSNRQPRPRLARSRSSDTTPRAADGQSADRSGSLQLPLLFLKAGQRAASGRPRPATLNRWLRCLPRLRALVIIRASIVAARYLFIISLNDRPSNYGAHGRRCGCSYEISSKQARYEPCNHSACHITHPSHPLTRPIRTGTPDVLAVCIVMAVWSVRLRNVSRRGCRSPSLPCP